MVVVFVVAVSDSHALAPWVPLWCLCISSPMDIVALSKATACNGPMESVSPTATCLPLKTDARTIDRSLDDD